MTNDDLEMTSELSAQQVEAYLLTHPEFFHNRDDLLSQLVIPHRRGCAISLVERQLSILRSVNTARQRDVDILLRSVRHSDNQFEHMRRLLLLLLESQTLNTAVDMVDDSLVHDFGMTAVSLILNADLFAHSALPTPRVPCYPAQDICRYSGLYDLFDNRRVVYSQLRSLELQRLFPTNWQTIKRTAIVPLHYRHPLGALIVGVEKDAKFPISRSCLSLIGEIFSRTLERFIPEL